MPTAAIQLRKRIAIAMIPKGNIYEPW